MVWTFIRFQPPQVDRGDNQPHSLGVEPHKLEHLPDNLFVKGANEVQDNNFDDKRTLIGYATQPK